LVIVACGSFSPPTYLHLRMFEMAKDQILEEGQYEILGGYYSPV
jgi:nicotinamide mononucleotide adenylyltransferase